MPGFESASIGLDLWTTRPRTIAIIRKSRVCSLSGSDITDGARWDVGLFLRGSSAVVGIWLSHDSCVGKFRVNS